VGLWLLAVRDCESESRQGHGCLSFVSVVCCQVHVFVMGRSRIQGSSTECGGCECGRETSMMMRPKWGFAPWRIKEKYMSLPAQLE